MILTDRQAWLAFVILIAVILALASIAFRERTLRNRAAIELYTRGIRQIHDVTPPTPAELELPDGGWVNIHAPKTYHRASRALGSALRAYGGDLPDRVLSSMIADGVVRADQE